MVAESSETLCAASGMIERIFLGRSAESAEISCGMCIDSGSAGNLEWSLKFAHRACRKTGEMDDYNDHTEVFLL